MERVKIIKVEDCNRLRVRLIADDYTTNENEYVILIKGLTPTPNPRSRRIIKARLDELLKNRVVKIKSGIIKSLKESSVDNANQVVGDVYFQNHKINHYLTGAATGYSFE